MRSWLIASAAAAAISLVTQAPVFAQGPPASGQQAPAGPADDDHPGWWDWREWMMGDDDNGPRGRMGWWGPGGPGMMWGGGMPMHSGMMPVMMMAMMDTDGNGSISFEEVEAVHRRIFNMLDSDKNGELSQDEMRAFVGAPAERRGN
jgi:hypothetical protein